MGIVSRLSRVTSARVEAFLSASERPECVIPRLVREMERQGRLIDRAVSKALASVRAEQRRLDEAEGRILRLENGARLALDHDDESLAREALAEAVRTGERRDRILSALTKAQDALDQARTAQSQIRDRIEDLKANKDAILARSLAARSDRRGARASNLSKESGDILERIAAIELDVDRDEAELEIRRAVLPGPSASLEDRLRRMELRAEIDCRMDALRKRKQPPGEQ